jgi:microcystin degradation protein MlrC
MKIACCGIAHETNTFTSLPTGLSDLYIRRADEIDDPVLDEFPLVEWARLLTASATPSGPITQSVYEALKDEILQGLEASLPLDGVYLPLHGAMEVTGIGDGESDLVGAVRELVGPAIPIAASLDLHGNVVPELCQAADILHAYRTAPHRDQDATRRRAIELLIQCIKTGKRPASAHVRVPLLLPGEKAITEVEPGNSLYQRLPEIDACEGVWTASLMCGFAWADVPEAAMTVFVFADDETTARNEAAGLAQEVWSHREEFGFDVETADIDESIRLALESSECVFLTDSGDNTTAGGAGDIPLFIESLIKVEAQNALVAGICDAAAVGQSIEAGIGAELELKLGGKLDTNFGPLSVKAVVEYISQEDGVVIVVLGGIKVIITNRRRAYTRVQQFTDLGLDPLAFSIVVIKLGYLFPELRDIAPRHIMALSPGFSNEVIEESPFHSVQRPIYPLDQEFDFDAESACRVFPRGA